MEPPLNSYSQLTGAQVEEGRVSKLSGIRNRLLRDTSTGILYIETGDDEKKFLYGGNIPANNIPANWLATSGAAKINNKPNLVWSEHYVSLLVRANIGNSVVTSFSSSSVPNPSPENPRWTSATGAVTFNGYNYADSFSVIFDNGFRKNYVGSKMVYVVVTLTGTWRTERAVPRAIPLVYPRAQFSSSFVFSVNTVQGGPVIDVNISDTSPFTFNVFIGRGSAPSLYGKIEFYKVEDAP